VTAGPDRRQLDQMPDAATSPSGGRYGRAPVATTTRSGAIDGFEPAVAIDVADATPA